MELVTRIDAGSVENMLDDFVRMADVASRKDMHFPVAYQTACKAIVGIFNGAGAQAGYEAPRRGMLNAVEAYYAAGAVALACLAWSRGERLVTAKRFVLDKLADRPLAELAAFDQWMLMNPLRGPLMSAADAAFLLTGEHEAQLEVLGTKVLPPGNVAMEERLLKLLRVAIAHGAQLMAAADRIQALAKTVEAFYPLVSQLPAGQQVYYLVMNRRYTVAGLELWPPVAPFGAIVAESVRPLTEHHGLFKTSAWELNRHVGECRAMGIAPVCLWDVRFVLEGIDLDNQAQIDALIASIKGEEGETP